MLQRRLRRRRKGAASLPAVPCQCPRPVWERAMQEQVVLAGDGEKLGYYLYNGSVANRALEPVLSASIGRAASA
jgi:hypothetical protein